MTNLLLQECPLIGYAMIAGAALSALFRWYAVAIVIIVFLAAILWYYNFPDTSRVALLGNELLSDNELVSPASGKVVSMHVDDISTNEGRTGHVHVVIQMSIMDVKGRVYPCNGTLVQVQAAPKRVSSFILAKNKSLVKLTQNCNIPNVITYSKNVPGDVLAGDYAGMVGRCSKVELLFPIYSGDGYSTFKLNDYIKLGQHIKIGDMIGLWQSPNTI
jgi:hypothetical protein